MIQTAYDMLYLCACALHGEPPLRERCDAMDAEALYACARRHSLTAMVAMALESAGVELTPAFREAKAKAIRKIILLDAERSAILSFMEERGIRHMPLKGVILKDMYPRTGMRQMADNDILFDEAFREEVRQFMEARGYTPGHVGKSNHDEYYKPPVYNFEMHTALFGDYDRWMELHDYYASVWDKLLPDEGKTYGLRFTDEDYYVYITAHEYKHIVNSGTGLRSLLDRYVYLTHKEGLDMAYVERECEAMGIADFERAARGLAMKVLASNEIPLLEEHERTLLESYLTSTTYGTMEQHVRNRMEGTDGRAKRRYLLERVFPPRSFYRQYAPTAYRYPVLIPFVWCRRTVKILLFRRKKVKKEIQSVRNIH